MNNILDKLAVVIFLVVNACVLIGLIGVLLYICILFPLFSVVSCLAWVICWAVYRINDRDLI